MTFLRLSSAWMNPCMRLAHFQQVVIVGMKTMLIPIPAQEFASAVSCLLICAVKENLAEGVLLVGRRHHVASFI